MMADVKFLAEIEDRMTHERINGSAATLEAAKDQAWKETKRIASTLLRGLYTVTMTFEQNGEWLCSEEGTILVSYGGNVEVCV